MLGICWNHFGSTLVEESKMMLIKRLVLAMFFTLMLIAGSAQAGGDAARGAELAADCGDCHGEDGRGDGDIPGIAGMDPAAHVKALSDYKSGAVQSEDMADFVADLSEQDMADLAAYFASLPKE
jgi:cytochrome c553